MSFWTPVNARESQMPFQFRLAIIIAFASAGFHCWAGEPPNALSAAEVMQLPAPPALRFKARDGAMLAYRLFAPPPSTAAPGTVAILYHGSAGSSRNMTLLADALAAAGVPAFAPDVRGQGLSGRRGDVDYIGQPDNDLADLIPIVRQAYPGARLVLVGHSAGGGFALRIAGEPLGRAFSRFVLLSPYLGRAAPSNRPDAGWARPDIPRIAFLAVMNQIGISGFNGWPVIAFQLQPGAEALGATRQWSYRMAMSYGPRGDLRLFGTPAYREDAARAPAPIILIAGAKDEQFFADRYATDFKGLERNVTVEITPGADHMGMVSDAGAIGLTVQAVVAAGSEPAPWPHLGDSQDAYPRRMMLRCSLPGATKTTLLGSGRPASWQI